ncbi:MAG: molybdenum cofactor guanylyltransferase [Spirochaetota bacterium]|nr:molybdenum cofactor guanylyltransferase [Spirochaetota bacterium]
MPGDKLLGMVLCGGLSSRMKSDKGLLEIQGQTWVEIAINIINPFSDRVVLSINNTQLDSYRVFSDKHKLIVDTMPLSGPLNGLLSVHRAYPQRDLLVLPCDLISMTGDSIAQLVAKYESDSNHDIYVFQNNGRMEPLVGIYRHKALANIEKELTNPLPADNKSRHSAYYHVERANSFYLSVNPTVAEDFKNYNSPEDL